MDFYEIPEEAAALGGMLEMDCPNNDCKVYRNTYRMYIELRLDYKTGEEIFSETTKRALRKEARVLGGEIEEMYFSNFAIREYRKAARRASQKAFDREFGEKQGA